MQPDSEIQAAKTAANSGKRRSDLVLIDVGLLRDGRFQGAFLAVGVGFSVPPQGSPLFLLLDDVRLFLEQRSDHPGDIGFVGFRHGGNYTLHTPAPDDPGRGGLPNGQFLYINTVMEAP